MVSFLEILIEGMNKLQMNTDISKLNKREHYDSEFLPLGTIGALDGIYQ